MWEMIKTYFCEQILECSGMMHFMQLKVPQGRKKWRRGEEQDTGHKMMLGVPGPQSLEQSDDL